MDEQRADPVGGQIEVPIGSAQSLRGSKGVFGEITEYFSDARNGNGTGTGIHSNQSSVRVTISITLFGIFKFGGFSEDKKPVLTIPGTRTMSA